MNDPRRTLPGLALALLLALGPPSLSGCAATAEGRKAPPVAGDHWLLLDGKEGSALLAGKWGLVVFFRPHLPDCNEGIGDLLELAAAYRARGLVAVAVTPDPAEEAKAFILRHDLPFPVLADARPVLDAWGLPDMWGNRVYLVNPAGVVLAQDDLPATRRILDKFLPK